MKNFVYSCVFLSLCSIVIAFITKFTNGTIAGIGPGGSLVGAMVFLLLGMNFGLLGILEK